MTLIEDGRLIHARARYQDITDLDDEYPPGPFGSWEQTVEAAAERDIPCDDDPESLCLLGRTVADADQYSEFFPGGLQFTGVTAGGWQGEPDGSYDVQSLARFKFRVDHPFRYNFNAIVSPPDTPAIGISSGHVLLEGPGGIQLFYLTDGAIADTSRLGPGEYVLEGLSYGDASDHDFVGAYYFAQWTVQEIPQPLLAYQPQDATVACGGTATFAVGPTAPASMTYQWRFNGQPLANGGRISGATGSTLTIANACQGDAGYYNVVASNGTVTEPSGYAQLVIQSSVTGVDQQDALSRPFSIRVAGPNPFHGATSFRYAASKAQAARVAIYGVNGALVRSLANGPLSGSGTLVWDGATNSGESASSGIYFLRAEAGSDRTVLKLVLMR